MSIKNFIDGIRFNFQNFFAIVIYATCIGLLGWIVVYAPQNNIQVGEVRVLCGAVLFIVINYYFGSSKHSNTKDEVIQNITEANKTMTEANKTLTEDAKK